MKPESRREENENKLVINKGAQKTKLTFENVILEDVNLWNIDRASTGLFKMESRGKSLADHENISSEIRDSNIRITLM